MLINARQIRRRREPTPVPKNENRTATVISGPVHSIARIKRNRVKWISSAGKHKKILLGFKPAAIGILKKHQRTELNDYSFSKIS
jgi:hypothetical protein